MRYFERMKCVGSYKSVNIYYDKNKYFRIGDAKHFSKYEDMEFISMDEITAFIDSECVLN